MWGCFAGETRKTPPHFPPATLNPKDPKSSPSFPRIIEKMQKTMNEQPLEIIAGKLLRRDGWRLAVAESCTGGLIGHRLTNVAGSSTYYMGSIIAYAYEAKVRLLNVRWRTLEQEGAVSEKVVIEMARGVRRALAADIGISVSGVAGPGGGTLEKPVGYTWMGLSTPHHEEAHQFTWDQDRIGNKELSAEATLKMLVDFLRSPHNGRD